MIDALFNQAGYAAAKQVLSAAALRHEAIARNLANIETPNYKRVDLAPSFEATLSQAIKAKDAAAINNAKPALTMDAKAMAGENGNSVDLEKELMQLNQNTLTYSLGTQLITGRILKMRMAITGRPL